MERAIIAALFRVRFDAERLLAQSAEKAQRLHARIAPFIEETRLGDALEDYDRELLAAPVGAFERDHMMDVSWSIEIAQLLAWALGIDAELATDRLVPDNELAKTLGVLRPEVASALIGTARYRPWDEVTSKARETVIWRHASRKKILDEKMKGGPLGGMPEKVYAAVVDRELEELGLPRSSDDERRRALEAAQGALLSPPIGKLYSVRIMSFEWLLGASETFWRFDEEA